MLQKRKCFSNEKNVIQTIKITSKQTNKKKTRIKANIIYGSTTVIANLICLANTPTPDLKIYHLDQNVTASCFRCWSIALTKGKLPIQYTINEDVYAEEAWNPSLHIIALTEGPVVYNGYHSSSFFKQSLFFVSHTSLIILKKNFNFEVFYKKGFLKITGKHLCQRFFLNIVSGLVCYRYFLSILQNF